MARDPGDFAFNLKSFARFFHLLHDFLEFAVTSCCSVITSPIYRTSSLVAENVSGSVTVPAPVIAVFGIRGL